MTLQVILKIKRKNIYRLLLSEVYIWNVIFAVASFKTGFSYNTKT